jgi:hypothetical protein
MLLNVLRFYSNVISWHKRSCTEDTGIGKALRLSLMCVICHEKLIAPVHTCSQSHYVCGHCHLQLNDENKKICFCKSKIIRFEGLDRTVETVHTAVECRFSDAGCEAVSNGRFIFDHMRVCKYRYILIN